MSMSPNGQSGGQLTADQINSAMSQLQGMPSDRPGAAPTGFQAFRQNPQVQRAAGAYQQFGGGHSVAPAPMPTMDPNLDATMQGLQAMMDRNRAKKDAIAKMFTGGG